MIIGLWWAVGVRGQIMRLCQSEAAYRVLEQTGALRDAIGAYAIGQRDTDVLDTLANARVWSHNFGEWVPVPVGYDRGTWHDILDKLVRDQLGTRRCLDCRQCYDPNSLARSCHIVGRDSIVKADPCPYCRSTTTEPIGCVGGVA